MSGPCGRPGSGELGLGRHGLLPDRSSASSHSLRSLSAANPAGRGGEAQSPGAPARGRQRARKTGAPGTTWREPAQERGTDEEASAMGT